MAMWWTAGFGCEKRSLGRQVFYTSLNESIQTKEASAAQAYLHIAQAMPDGEVVLSRHRLHLELEHSGVVPAAPSVRSCLPKALVPEKTSLRADPE